MGSKGLQQILLATLGVAVLGGGLFMYWPRQAGGGPGASKVTGGSSGTVTAETTAPDVHIEALQAERPKPDELSRNLFRFKPKPAPPPPPRPVTPPPPPRPTTVPPSGPPPLPPIPLKFSAILTQGPDKLAVLVDAYGHVIYGKEGGTVEGRYKIWRIGVESIEMSYLDGQGRQTIRLSGQ